MTNHENNKIIKNEFKFYNIKVLNKKIQNKFCFKIFLIKKLIFYFRLLKFLKFI